MPNTFSYLKPRLETISISPKMVQLFVPPIKWRGDPKGHVGKYDTFFYVVDGECSLSIDGDSTVLKTGDLAFLPSGKMRSYSNMSRSITLYEMNFVATVNGDNWFSALGFSDSGYTVHPANSEHIKELFEASVRYEYNKSPVYDVTHASSLLSLINIFSLELMKKNDTAAPFKSVIEYIKSNIQKQIKVNELAELSFMEETYFIKRFKKALGDTPITYINKLRIYAAMRLLAESDKSLSEIAHEVGIYDSSYFSKLFKSNTGLTPGEYREIFTD